MANLRKGKLPNKIKFFTLFQIIFKAKIKLIFVKKYNSSFKFLIHSSL